MLDLFLMLGTPRLFFWESSGFPNGLEYLERGVSFNAFGRSESFKGDGLFTLFLLGAFLIFKAGRSPTFFGVYNLLGVFTCDE